jgi:hypothetical protein
MKGYTFSERCIIDVLNLLPIYKIYCFVLQESIKRTLVVFEDPDDDELETPFLYCIMTCMLTQIKLSRLLPITTKNFSSNPAHGEVYSMQHYVINFVSDLRQVGGFLRVLRFPPSIVGQNVYFLTRNKKNSFV